MVVLSSGKNPRQSIKNINWATVVSKGLCLAWMDQPWDVVKGPYLTPDKCSINVCNMKEGMNSETLNNPEDFLE